MENYYHALEVLPTATPEEIKESYLRLRANVSSSGLDETEIAQRMSELEKAFTTLSDSNERANYDRSLGATTDADSTTSLTLLERPATLLRPETATPLVQQACPHCGYPNPVQATMCAQCGQQVARPCPSCGNSVLLNQTVCPRCNTFLPEYDQRRLAQSLLVEHKVQAERMDSESKVQALEAGHRVRAAQGVIFWIVVALGCMAVAAIPILIFRYVINNP